MRFVLTSITDAFRDVGRVAARRAAACLLALTVALCAPFVPVAAQTPFTLDTRPAASGTVSGLWWNPQESGWGMSLTQQANIIFAAMYTYEAAGAATWYVASRCVVTDDGCTGDFYAVTGGTAPTLPWAGTPLSVSRVGLFTVRFTDINNGTVAYSINAVNGVKAITRQLWVATEPPATTLVWEKSPDLNVGMPAGVEVFRGSGNGLRALYATVDSAKNANVEWNVASVAPGALTASEFSALEPKRAYVVVNGGYFGASTINQSFSLIVKNGALAAPGVKQLTRSGQIYYPTRAAFGTLATGETSATWAYPVGTANVVTQFPLPSPNNSARPPQAAVTASFPPGGRAWSPVKAIGGGPMLIRNGSKTITAAEEVFDAGSGITPDSAAPRSAIGKLASGAVILMVVDGRSALSRGVTLSELADMLLSLGAVEAINLDGGGSSNMVVNGVVANAPSDGVQRSIPSVVMIRER